VSGEYTGGSPLVVVIGSASRDLAASDPRGWRLGGGVTYGALTLARLGVPVAALVGVDRQAAGAWELDLLRDAGAVVRLAPLADGPVFENEEGPTGRRQVCHHVGGPITVTALPVAWRDAPGWLFAPVAAELPAAWADVPPPGARVALGWQGLLRRLTGGRPVRGLAPRPNRLLARADLVAVSAADLAAAARLSAWAGWMGARRPDQTELVVTAGARGGIEFRVADGRVWAVRRYRALASPRAVDPTGAGDVFLAAWMAARLTTGLAHRAPAAGTALAVAAAAAGLVVEGPGVAAVPTLAQTAARLAGRA
jgi:sugar/nucleoside kinase (ribokinase family)